MGVGAIVVVQADKVVERGASSDVCSTGSNGPQNLADRPLEFLEVLGRSTLERTIEHLKGVDVEAMSVLVHWDVFPMMPALRGSHDDVAIMAALDLGFQVALALKAFAEKGIEHAFVVRPNAYCEADLREMLECHREGQTLVTRAVDAEGPLDLWVIDCDAAWQPSISSWDNGMFDGMLRQGSYFVRQYSKRITVSHDLRMLVVDAFTGRSQMRPSGKEVQPNVWMDDGAEVYRGARIVGPAFLGRGCTIGENTVVSNFSNIESGSYVDYGTTIDDSTVLPNTYVGIGLDVRNSVVQANRVLNLTRDVVIEVSDPNIFRSTVVEAKAGAAKLALMNLLNLARNDDSEQAAEEEETSEHETQETECFSDIPSINARTEFES